MSNLGGGSRRLVQRKTSKSGTSIAAPVPMNTPSMRSLNRDEGGSILKAAGQDVNGPVWGANKGKPPEEERTLRRTGGGGNWGDVVDHSNSFPDLIVAAREQELQHHKEEREFRPGGGVGPGQQRLAPKGNFHHNRPYPEDMPPGPHDYNRGPPPGDFYPPDGRGYYPPPEHFDRHRPPWHGHGHGHGPGGPPPSGYGHGYGGHPPGPYGGYPDGPPEPPNHHRSASYGERTRSYEARDETDDDGLERPVFHTTASHHHHQYHGPPPPQHQQQDSWRYPNRPPPADWEGGRGYPGDPQMPHGMPPHHGGPPPEGWGNFGPKGPGGPPKMPAFVPRPGSRSSFRSDWSVDSSNRGMDSSLGSSRRENHSMEPPPPRPVSNSESDPIRKRSNSNVDTKNKLPTEDRDAVQDKTVNKTADTAPETSVTDNKKVVEESVQVCSEKGKETADESSTKEVPSADAEKANTFTREFPADDDTDSQSSSNKPASNSETGMSPNSSISPSTGRKMVVSRSPRRDSVSPKSMESSRESKSNERRRRIDSWVRDVGADDDTSKPDVKVEYGAHYSPAVSLSGSRVGSRRGSFSEDPGADVSLSPRGRGSISWSDNAQKSAPYKAPTGGQISDGATFYQQPRDYQPKDLGAPPEFRGGRGGYRGGGRGFGYEYGGPGGQVEGRGGRGFPYRGGSGGGFYGRGGEGDWGRGAGAGGRGFEGDWGRGGGRGGRWFDRGSGYKQPPWEGGSRGGFGRGFDEGRGYSGDDVPAIAKAYRRRNGPPGRGWEGGRHGFRDWSDFERGGGGGRGGGRFGYYEGPASDHGSYRENHFSGERLERRGSWRDTSSRTSQDRGQTQPRQDVGKDSWEEAERMPRSNETPSSFADFAELEAAAARLHVQRNSEGSRDQYEGSQQNDA